MNGIAISLIELLIKGVPEGLLTVLALHIFTKTKIDLKKYFMISISYITIIYLIRFLPITLGINTMFSILILILLFQAVYKTQLKKIVVSVASAVVIVIIILISEFLNITLLELLYGEAKTLELLKSSTSLAKSISTIPSTLFTAVFIYIGYKIIKSLDKRKIIHGKAGEKTGE